MLRQTLVFIAVLGLSACQSAPKKAPEPAQQFTDLGAVRSAAEQAYAAGDWRAAVPHYETLVRALPQDQQFWFRLGNAYARSERPDAAVVSYREALVRNSQEGKVWFNMGLVQLRQAANSFRQMQQHVADDDPIAAQGAEAYAAIMAVLGQPAQVPNESAASFPAPVPSPAAALQAIDAGQIIEDPGSLLEPVQAPETDREGIGSLEVEPMPSIESADETATEP